MYKHALSLILLVLALSACGKKEQEKQEMQLRLQADQSRLELQQKADELARNPPPEILKAARERASAEAGKH